MKAELVFIPLPEMGHLISTVEVAKHLVDLNPNLFITFLIFSQPHDSKVTAYVDSLAANTTTSRIKFTVLPQPQLDRNLPPAKLMGKSTEFHRPILKDAVNDVVLLSTSVPHLPQLAGFVLDMFYANWIDLGDEFGVPSYIFYTSGAAFLGFQFFMQDLHDEGKFGVVELKDDSETEFAIPSYVNPVSAKHFPTVLLKPDSFPLLINLSRKLREVKGIMINTYTELESHAINSLVDDGRIPSVYSAGPLLNLNSGDEVDQNSDSNIKWLDEQPPSSVIFLCFGSMGSFCVDQVKEIADALERSGHRFLWSLRQPPNPEMGMMGRPTDYDNVAEVLPEGFLDRTAEIGKIIGWAPQVAILAHPAIGGFMSHCGWNSTLESIWYGVPMAAWPLYAEQQLNAFELVMDLGLAVDIKMDYRKDNMGNGEIDIVSSDKIERGIRCLMEEDSNVRKRMKEMSETSRKALMEGGSSHSALCRFIDNVLDNMPEE